MAKYYSTSKPGFEEKDKSKPTAKQKIVSKPEPAQILTGSKIQGLQQQLSHRWGLLKGQVATPSPWFSTAMHPDTPHPETKHPALLLITSTIPCQSSLCSLASSVSNRSC